MNKMKRIGDYIDSNWWTWYALGVVFGAAWLGWMIIVGAV